MSSGKFERSSFHSPLLSSSDDDAVDGLESSSNNASVARCGVVAFMVLVVLDESGLRPEGPWHGCERLYKGCTIPR